MSFIPVAAVSDGALSYCRTTTPWRGWAPPCFTLRRGGGGPRRGGVALGWLLVVVWPAMALSGVPLGGVAFGAVMRLSAVCPRRWGSRQLVALMLSGAALEGDAVLATVWPSVAVWPSAETAAPNVRLC